jgi:2-oxoisovalerate dehydrogenase E1 component alpha subunit
LTQIEPAVQLLSPDGERLADDRYEIDLSHAALRDLYRDLVLVRRLDQEATALQRQGELALWAPCLGQEAAQIGSARSLLPTDMAFPTYREHGVAWSRGVTPLQLLSLFRGVTNGGWDPGATRCALYSIVIGSQTLHAAGYALGASLQGSTDATIAYFGDGATDEGDVNEAFVLAAGLRLPLVLFCQNNHWAISTPRDGWHGAPIHQRATGFGFPGVLVDGNDVLAVMAVTRVALDRARSGGGPTLIEAVTYRMGAHTTSDDPTRYRSADELGEWERRDPVRRLGAYLERVGAWDERFRAEIQAEADELAVAIRREVRRLPVPAPESMFDDVYAEPHPTIAEQRADLLAYEESFAREGAP